MGRTQHRLPPLEECRKLVEALGKRGTARHLGLSYTTFTDRYDRMVRKGVEPSDPDAPQTDRPGMRESVDGTLTFASDVKGTPAAPWKPEEVMRAHGQDPAEYVIVRVRFNRWGDPDAPMHQLRFDAVPRESLIQFPDPAHWKPPPKPRRRKATNMRPLIADVISDHHAPHHDRVFHRLFLEHLAADPPDLIEVNGDLMDLSTISRHREREGYAQPVNECLEAGFGIFRDYREVAPKARVRFKRGNHDERLLHMILDNARELHRIAPANEDIPALDLRRLLHLDALGIEYVDEEWDVAKTRLSPKLTARHGFSTAKNATDQMLSKLAGSTIQGHTHRFGMKLHTEHTGDEDDPVVVRMAIEGGCACEIPGGLGYIPGGEPNWQNGFTRFHVWPDGDFHATPGIYVNRRLFAPGGKRYTAP